MKKSEQKKIDACKDFADVYELYRNDEKLLAYQAAEKIYKAMGEPALIEICDLFDSMAGLDLSWACDISYMDFITKIVYSVIDAKFNVIETMIKRYWGVDESTYLWCINKRNALRAKYGNN